MILQIEQYIQQYPRVSLSELALHFQMPIDVLSEMLTLLQRKNRLNFQVQNTRKSCSDCSSCEGCVTE